MNACVVEVAIVRSQMPGALPIATRPEFLPCDGRWRFSVEPIAGSAGGMKCSAFSPVRAFTNWPQAAEFASRVRQCLEAHLSPVPLCPKMSALGFVPETFYGEEAVRS